MATGGTLGREDARAWQHACQRVELMVTLAAEEANGGHWKSRSRQKPTTIAHPVARVDEKVLAYLDGLWD